MGERGARACVCVCVWGGGGYTYEEVEKRQPMFVILTYFLND